MYTIERINVDDCLVFVLINALQTMISTRLMKTILRQENSYNLARSKLQLVLSHASSLATSRSSTSYTILFSSEYQRQDWLDVFEKTQQELIQRNSMSVNHQRSMDGLIQKRLELIKPSHGSQMSDVSNLEQASRTYSGTLTITIHSLDGSALSNDNQQQTSMSINQSMLYQFYVAVEIDSYKTFYPYAETKKQSMQRHDSVEFRGEV
jgi:hypothetical protein